MMKTRGSVDSRDQKQGPSLSMGLGPLGLRHNEEQEESIGKREKENEKDDGGSDNADNVEDG